jgi:hypothetical protein
VPFVAPSDSKILKRSSPFFETSGPPLKGDKAQL